MFSLRYRYTKRCVGVIIKSKHYFEFVLEGEFPEIQNSVLRTVKDAPRILKP